MGVLAEGMAFGVGSSIAHRMVDSIMGPRTVQVQDAAPTNTNNADGGGGGGDGSGVGGGGSGSDPNNNFDSGSGGFGNNDWADNDDMGGDDEGFF